MPTGRSIQQIQGTADAFGNATFTLPGPPVGFVWTGVIDVPNPGQALFTVNTSINWGTYQGTDFGPFQIWTGETLTVTAAGLVPLTQYSLVFTGTVEDQTQVEPVWPSPAGAVNQAQNSAAFNAAAVVSAAGTTPVKNLDVTGWDHVALSIATDTHDLGVTLTWNDKATPSGAADFVTEFTVVANGLAQPTFRNMARFLTITLQGPGGGSTANLNVTLLDGATDPRWLTNAGTAPSAFGGPLISGNLSIGGGVTNMFTATTTYAGPGLLTAVTTAASWAFELDGFDFNGNKYLVGDYNVAQGSTKAPINIPLQLPPLKLVLSVANFDVGAQTFIFGLWPQW